MRLFKIIIIGFFLVVLSNLAYSVDYSQCVSDCKIISTTDNTRTMGSYPPDYVLPLSTISFCAPSAYGEVSYTSEPHDYGGVVNGAWESSWKSDVTKHTIEYTCCTEPDEDYTYDGNLTFTGTSLNSCSLDTTEITARHNECNALNGQFYAIEKRDCCTISRCYAEPQDDNTTNPNCQNISPSLTGGYPLFSVNESEGICGAGVSSGDFRWVSLSNGTSCCFINPDANDTCPDTFECVASAYDSASNTYSNIYDVISCTGAIYADKTREENFSCFDVNNTNPITCPQGQTKDNNGNCQADANNDGIPDNEQSNTDNNNTDPCNYPLIYNEKTYQGMSFSYNGCVPYYNDLGFEAEYLKYDDCNNGACYKGNVLPPENNTTNNNTDNPTNDNNNTSTDNNTTNPNNNDSNSTSYDFSKLENKLDEVKNSLNANSEVNHNDLTKVDGSINNMNTNLGDKLNKIKSTIQGTSDGIRTDISKTNDLLKDIDDKLSEDFSTDTSEFDTSFANAKNVFSDAMASFSQNALDLRSLASGVVAPRITASGSCVLSGTTAHIGSFQFDFSKVSILRLPLQFVLNLYLVLFTFRLYTRIARDIASYILRG